ncbi:DUF6631 family protein [Caldimonas brevitalea]|uniref:Uncharacterized protein n=1 Tax=Caldimonas brevitalea TaxID=413882 RepID=A0A0G3BRS3_9BURK|nr:DUF6631 family protein [Caldimonas brevitalea]AKJ30683.1 hypothetical protein AAW51_3992 [Caldimonas brevitalea]
MSTSSDLEILVPPAQQLDIAGERLEIRPLVLGELPAVLKAVRPFAAQLAGGPDWLALFAEHGEALLQTLTLTARKPREWVDQLAVDDALALAAAVFEVNADFFVRRVAPRIGDLAQQLSTRLAGPTPSPG